jgi:hypothetical protein
VRLISFPRNGLCNRLKAISSCYILSQECNRQFEIMWEPESNNICGVDIEELFEYDAEYMPHKSVDFDSKILNRRKRRKMRRVGDKVFVSHDFENTYTEWVASNKDDQDVVFVCGGDAKLPAMEQEEYDYKKQTFYNNLPIKYEIMQKINDFKKNFEGKRVLGVHIRGGDTLNDDIYKWRRLGIRKYGDFLETITHREIFESVLRTISPSLDDHDAIYVCSDEMSIVDMFTETFDNVFVYPKDEVDRNSSSGMEDALIDWWLLGECDHIFYTFGSTFGPEASIRHGGDCSTEFKFEGG